jgi:hypothetical protein
MDVFPFSSPPASTLEYAGKQDEVIRLKAALNEKDMSLIELREQHMQLVVRTAAHQALSTTTTSSTHWAWGTAAEKHDKHCTFFDFVCAHTCACRCIHVASSTTTVWLLACRHVARKLVSTGRRH